jgi:diacylglycerol kinase (ATP)
MKPIQPLDRSPRRHSSISPRFRDAFSGFYQAYREEPNLRFHVFAGTCVGIAAYAVGVEGWETAYVAFSITLVLFAEMVNTAVERAVDLAAAGRRHPMAAMAKEVAAGAVLLAALHATFAAVMLFVIRRGVLMTVGALWGLLQTSPWMFIVPILAGVLGLVGGRKAKE